ncbi:tetratricopeptide repeat protein [Sphingomonas sp. LT1P40]|uniref:tetratricopeptide repeat protein n=1 Tax=Alteristakelama amylovorans TaxID=3096166 RepID=UPI002FCA7DA3
MEKSKLRWCLSVVVCRSPAQPRRMRFWLITAGAMILTPVAATAAQVPLDTEACVTVQDAPATCLSTLVKAAGDAFTKGEPAIVERYAARAIAVAKAASVPPTIELGQAYNLLGTAVAELGSLPEGASYYARAIEIYDGLANADHDKRIALHNLGWNLSDRREFDAAGNAFARALTIARSLKDRDGEYRAYEGLGVVQYNAGRNAEADETLRRALGVAIQLWGDNDAETGRAYRMLGLNLDAQARYDDAEPIYRKALSIFVKTHGDKHVLTPMTYFNLAGTLLASGKFKEAAKMFGRSHVMYVALKGAGHPQTVAVAFQLGQVRWELGDERGGLTVMEESMAAMAKVSGNEDMTYAGQQKLLAMFLHQVGRHDEDERLRRESLATYTKRLSPTDGSLIGAMAEFGTLLLFHEKPAEALAYHRLAATRLTKRLADSSRDSILLNERNRKRSYYRMLVTTLWFVGP